MKTEKTQIVSLRFSETDLASICRISKRLRISRSAVIRAAISRLLEDDYLIDRQLEKGGA